MRIAILRVRVERGGEAGLCDGAATAGATEAVVGETGVAQALSTTIASSARSKGGKRTM